MSFKRKETQPNIIMRIVLCVLVALLCTSAGEIILIIIAGRYVGTAKFLMVIFSLAIFSFFCPILTSRRMTALLLITIGNAILVSIVSLAVWRSFLKTAEYIDADNGKNNLFSDQIVMIIAPHQDDEYNLGEGIIEEYLKYGSEVYIVFTTNGDAVLTAETRLTEALSIAEYYGISEDHIIFLGYGNQYKIGSKHIYNDYEDIPIVSRGGHEKTYALETKNAYNEGAYYTRSNFVGDIQNVILQYRPSVIICCDYDNHQDHAATSMAFEEAMGKILQAGLDYSPMVMKGFAYCYAYYAEQDYYAQNIKSTITISDNDYFTIPNYYLWSERIRFPVSASTLSRSLFFSKSYQGAKRYKSQNLTDKVAGIVNGDKVYWQRRTDSLLYNADIVVSSGEARRLNDFKLIDCEDVYTEEMLSPYYFGTWIPDEMDTNPKITIIMQKPTEVGKILLYDCPSLSDNILNAVVCFEDGTTIETGPLPSNGSALELDVSQTNLTTFSIIITEREGKYSGLCEVEAYPAQSNSQISFVKLQDKDKNFIYDYDLTNADEEFLIYSYGFPEMPKYSVSCQGEGCSAVLEEGKVNVHCPFGKSCLLTVTDENSGDADTIFIHHKGLIERTGQTIEKMLWKIFPKIKGTCTFRLFIKYVFYALPDDSVGFISMLAGISESN